MHTQEETISGTLISVVAYFNPTRYGPATYGHVLFTDAQGQWVRTAVMHYAKTGLTFTPKDQYGPQPETLEDLATCEWYCGAIRAALENGLPVLPDNAPRKGGRRCSK
ncbi:MAG: hypothetical protein ACOYBO_07690 [Azonexus sp.]